MTTVAAVAPTAPRTRTSAGPASQDNGNAFASLLAGASADGLTAAGASTDTQAAPLSDDMDTDTTPVANALAGIPLPLALALALGVAATSAITEGATEAAATEPEDVATTGPTAGCEERTVATAVATAPTATANVAPPAPTAPATDATPAGFAPSDTRAPSVAAPTSTPAPVLSAPLPTAPVTAAPATAAPVLAAPSTVAAATTPLTAADGTLVDQPTTSGPVPAQAAASPATAPQSPASPAAPVPATPATADADPAPAAPDAAPVELLVKVAAQGFDVEVSLEQLVALPADAAQTQAVPAAAPAVAPAPVLPITAVLATAPTAPLPPAAQVVQVLTPVLEGPDGSYTLSLELYPEELGAVQVEVSLRAGEVRLALHAPDGLAQDTLRGALGDLRRQLEASGLTPIEMSVDGGAAQEHHGRPSGRDHGASAGHATTATDTTPLSPQTSDPDAALDVRI